MKRKDFLRLIGVAAAAFPGAKLLGLPKDADGFYLDKAAPGTESEGAWTFLDSKDENLYVALYKDLTSNASGMVECDYKEYSRVAVPRSSEGWRIEIPDKRVLPSHIENAKAITFPECKERWEIVTAVGIETVDRRIIWCGELSCPFEISPGITPEFAAGELTIEM